MVLKSKITKKINPTDEELLKKLKIKKEYFPETNEIFYIVLLNNNEIGSAVYRTNKNVVDSTGIDKEYRRRGVNTWLYDYIEKDQNVKLTPSKTLMREGELFWRNRLKRSNPRDDEFLKKIRIIKRLEKDLKVENTYYIIYDIYLNTQKYRIGFVVVRRNDDYVLNVDIDEEYRRKGLASFVYDYIEKDLNIKLRPSFNQLDDGVAFWKSRSKKNPSPKSKPKNARTLKTPKTKTPR